MSLILRAITPTATPTGAKLQFLFEDGALEELDIAFADLLRAACALLTACVLVENAGEGNSNSTNDSFAAFAHGVRSLSRERTVYLAEQLLAVRREVLTLYKEEALP